MDRFIHGFRTWSLSDKDESQEPWKLKTCAAEPENELSWGNRDGFVTGQVLSKCYVSETSSPTRFYFQEGNDRYWSELAEMHKYYDEQVNKQRKKEFDLDIWDLSSPGKRVVAYYGNYHFDRAEMITGVRSSNDTIKLFFIDYGSVAHVKMNLIKKITPQYNEIPPLAYRAALSGIEPPPLHGMKLWPEMSTSYLVNLLKNKPGEMTIVKHHEQGNFYEVKIKLGSVNVADTLVKKNLAMKTINDVFWGYGSDCLTYPPFEFLEKLDYYPTFDERAYLSQNGVDFNAFEEKAVKNLSLSNLSNMCPLEKAETIKKTFKDALTAPEHANVNRGFQHLINGGHGHTP